MWYKIEQAEEDKPTNLQDLSSSTRKGVIVIEELGRVREKNSVSVEKITMNVGMCISFGFKLFTNK